MPQPVLLQEDDLILLLRSSKLKPSQIVPRLDRLAPSQGSWRPRDQSEERHVSASSYAMDSDSEIGGSGVPVHGFHKKIGFAESHWSQRVAQFRDA